MADARRILVIDDEESSGTLTHHLLAADGYTVQSERDGAAGLRAFFSWRPDLVVLDVMMPRMDGWQVLDRIRELADTPVLMLTGRGDEQDKVRGLHHGADDYLVKPYAKDEFLARVQALLRRTRNREEPEDSYADDRLFMDFGRRRVMVDGRDVDLSPLEFRILAVLVRSGGRVLTQNDLLDQCWGERPGGPSNVRVYIGYLRKKVERDPKKPELVQTIREVGYRYVRPS